ncbi:hypothetical protein [Marinomonas posidonica]|uniref:Uncharacterized protein n=1 Tax=Marinomonas posidonica (strain CECT 7376 / NCIMB 14433 / IVIA-Po-181) TaxID=491952 RepID=F6CSV5_MARPP|nr:hypothetical protein [Marinomonas posidonica]AEF53945.1 hypothetical protein Mar181_0894 [Marinomonas posidonica IVIA-Po-181]
MALGHLAQNKFGLELSDINLYDGKETTSSSLADTLLSDVKGGVVVDTDSSEAGKMYLDVNGESKTSQIDTLGHEVLETQDFQGKGNGILFSNSEDTQEALGDAFGNQLADRINQAAGGDLDSTGGSDFNQRQVASYSVQQGTNNANKVGNAEVDHRQLYVAEAQAIIKAAPAYAKQRGISENKAKTELTQQALRQVDQTWSEQIEENPEAREMLADIALEIGQVSESALGRGSLDIGFDTESSEAFQAKDQETFNDTNINAREIGLIEKGWGGEANFIEKYGTKNGEKAVDVGLGDAAEEAIDSVRDFSTAAVEGIQQDPLGVAKNAAETVVNGVVDAVTSPLDTFVFEDSKGSAADRQLVAELQGNAETATKEAGSNLIDSVSELMPPGVGKAAKGTTIVVAKEAVEQASKKIDYVDTDSEMIGLDQPTYSSVVHKTIDSNQVNREMEVAGNDAAWIPDDVVKTETLLPGYELEMIVTEGQLTAIGEGKSAIGGWASKDALSDTIQEARDFTAVQKKWKNEDYSPLYKITLEVKEPITGQSGTADEMYDTLLDRTLPGGVEQFNFDDNKDAFNKLDVTDAKLLEP